MKRVNGASDRARSNVKREHSDRRNLRDRFYCTVLPLERSLIEVGTGRVSAPHFRISRSDKRDKGRPISRIRSVFRSPLFFFFFYRYYSDNMYIYIYMWITVYFKGDFKTWDFKCVAQQVSQRQEYRSVDDGDSIRASFYNNNSTNFVFYIEMLLIYRILVVCDFWLFICIQEGSKWTVEEGYLGRKFRKKILLVKYSFIASEWKIQTAFIFELNNDVHDPIILIILFSYSLHYFFLNK